MINFISYGWNFLEENYPLMGCVTLKNGHFLDYDEKIGTLNNSNNEASKFSFVFSYNLTISDVLYLSSKPSFENDLFPTCMAP